MLTFILFYQKFVASVLWLVCSCQRVYFVVVGKCFYKYLFLFLFYLILFLIFLGYFDTIILTSFLVFLDYFDILISKIILKIKNNILIYF